MDLYSSEVQHDFGTAAKVATDFNSIAKTLLIESELMEQQTAQYNAEKKLAKAAKEDKLRPVKKRVRKEIQKEKDEASEVCPVMAFQQDPNSRTYTLLQQY